jgi:D-beta-D-heptose 7-phosphate kinase / D-beta-D-heptose 1-phosphate adenosyltransferase
VITSFEKTIKVIKNYRNKGKKVGLVTGCFDLIHIDHIKFLRNVKKYVDILVVGLDSDDTIRVLKGKGRPVNSISVRLEQLNELKSVDYVFPLEVNFNDSNSDDIHFEILQSLKPDSVLTNVNADNYSKNKEIRTKNLGVDFIGLKLKKSWSSSDIFDELVKNK